MSTTVIIPTKNEVIGVEKILPQVKKEWADEWIVMDGNSKDGTVDAAEKLNFKVIQQNVRVQVMHVGKELSMHIQRMYYFSIQTETVNQNTYQN